MTNIESLFSVQKIEVSFPMWIVDNFAPDIENSESNASYNSVIADKLLAFAKAFMENEPFIRKNISFEFVEDNEEMTEEEINEKILFSREYVEFIKTMMDGGIIPPLQEEKE